MESGPVIGNHPHAEDAERGIRTYRTAERGTADADSREEPGGFAGRIALGEERFEDVEREAERLYGRRAGTDDDAFYPESDEGSQGTEAGEDVSVVSPGLLDHTAQLCVTVSSCITIPDGR